MLSALGPARYGAQCTDFCCPLAWIQSDALRYWVFSGGLPILLWILPSHLQEFFAMSVKFIVDLNFFSHVALLSLLIFRGHLFMSHNFCPSIVWLFVVDCVHFYFWKSSSWLCAMIFLRGSVLTVNSIFFGGVTGFSINLVSVPKSRDISTLHIFHAPFLFACLLFLLYPFYVHESIARSQYNHRGFGFC